MHARKQFSVLYVWTALLLVAAPAAAQERPNLDVPYVPTPQPVVEAMLKLAGVKEGEVVYDLGCGDGRIVVTAVKQFKAKLGVGLDLDPERMKDSWVNALAAGVTDKVEFKVRDVLKLDSVADANVVTLYLLPSINEKIAPMLKRSLKPGARIVSHDFRMGDWAPDKTERIEGEGGRVHVLYLWTIK